MQLPTHINPMPRDPNTNLPAEASAMPSTRKSRIVIRNSKVHGRGVYAARVHVQDRWFRGAVNIGHNPTFRSREEETPHLVTFAVGSDVRDTVWWPLSFAVTFTVITRPTSDFVSL